MEQVRKRWLQKRWTDDVEENLKIIGIRNWHIVARPEGMEKSIGSPSLLAGGLEREETEEEEEEKEEKKEKEEKNEQIGRQHAHDLNVCHNKT